MHMIPLRWNYIYKHFYRALFKVYLFSIKVLKYVYINLNHSTSSKYQERKYSET